MALKYKAASGGSSPFQDESAYWIIPLNELGEPDILPDAPDNCDHAEAIANKRSKKCNECGAYRYTRVSNFIKAGDVPSDYENLYQRETRYAVKGILSNEAYVAQARQFDPDKDSWDFTGLNKRAQRDQGIWMKAQWGTAVHAWTEDVDNGESSREPLADKPDFSLFGPAMADIETSWRNEQAKELFITEFKKMRKDVQSFMDLSVAHGVTFERCEAMIVLDEYKVAGKLDRLGNVATWSERYCCDKPHVFDTKTGSVDYGKRGKSMQFGSYSLGKLYDPRTHQRKDSGACTKTAYIMHIPMMQPKESTLIGMSIERARTRLDLAHDVWTEHSVRNYLKRSGMGDYIEAQIIAAASEADLDALYARMNPYWSEEHTAMAQAKKFN
jgi:hypothetical protein